VRTEMRGVVEEAGKRILWIPQLLHVGEEAARLDRVEEVRWGLRPPLVERRGVGKAVEGVVDFNRVEGSRVVLEPARGGELSWIDVTSPVFVLPSRAPDTKASCHGLHAPSPGSDRGQNGVRTAMRLDSRH
jgi:hypothetical protein